MTTITNNLVWTKAQFPLQGPPTPDRAKGDVPQHVVRFYGLVSAAAPTSPDVNAFYAAVPLADNYVYQVTDFSVRISGAYADIGHYLAVTTLEVGLQPGSMTQYLACNSWGQIQEIGTSSKIYVPERMPSEPIVPQSTDFFTWNVLAQATDTGVVEAKAFVRALAFDRQQYEQWPLHTPGRVII